MNTYYIFCIKREARNIYKNSSLSLYKILYNLYNFNKSDLDLGLSIYNELCCRVEINKLTEYIKLLPISRNVGNKYFINNCVVVIRPSCIILKYDSLGKDIIYILNGYSKFLFVCDFKNNTYYWLNEV